MTTEERYELINQFTGDIATGKFDDIIAYNIKHWSMKQKTFDQKGYLKQYMKTYMHKRNNSEEDNIDICKWQRLEYEGRCPNGGCRRHKC